MTATVPSNTSMILLEVSNSSPREAALIANAVSSSLVSTTADLLPPAKKGAPAIRVQVVQPAVLPSTPSGPNILMVALIGAAAGLLLGLGVALALESRRERRTASARGVSSVTPPAEAARPEPATAPWTWGSENA